MRRTTVHRLSAMQPLLHEIKRPGATQKFSSNSAKRIRLHSLQLRERFNPLGQALGWTATRPERRRYSLCEQLRFLVRDRWLYHSSSGGDTNRAPVRIGLIKAD
jgi:hypothetical protein